MRCYYTRYLLLGAILASGCGSNPTPTPTPAARTPKGNEQAHTPMKDSQEVAELQGTWQVIAIEAAGKPVPAERIQKLNLQYIFNGDKVTIHRPDRPDHVSTFTVDGTKSSKQITMHQTPVVRGIYTVEGKTLRLCMMVEDKPNAGFPTELASKASPKTDLLTLERR